MRAHQQLVRPHLRWRAERTPMRSQPKPTKPNAWWGIDMAKGLVEGFGWVSTVAVFDG
jgi:putative transposase